MKDKQCGGVEPCKGSEGSVQQGARGTVTLVL